MLRWFATNLRTFLLAFLLALIVWVSAATAADPDEIRKYPVSLPIEIVGQQPGLVIFGTAPTQVELTLRAPRSIWAKLSADPTLIRVLLDLTGKSAGVHTVDLQVQIGIHPVQIIQTSPSRVDLTLEALTTRTMPVDLDLFGEPAIGYQAGTVDIKPGEVVISGPQSLVNLAHHARVSINIAGIRENIEQSTQIQIVDQNSVVLSGLTISPATAQIFIPVTQQGGYRDLAVKVVIEGQVASGFRLTNISVFPPVVTVYSENPSLVINLPGVLETKPLNLNNASDDIVARLELDLPENIVVVGNGENGVLVEVRIEAIQGSLTFSNQEITVLGLAPQLSAQTSPKTVDIIISGPLSTLDALTTDQVRVTIDVGNLPQGKHQLIPQIEILLENIEVKSILPETVEVIIGPASTATPTPRP